MTYANQASERAITRCSQSPERKNAETVVQIGTLSHVPDDCTPGWPMSRRALPTISKTAAASSTSCWMTGTQLHGGLRCLRFSPAQVAAHRCRPPRQSAFTERWLSTVRQGCFRPPGPSLP